MTARFYDVHGVGLEVRSEEPAALVAMERRLQAFRRSPTPRAEIRLEFLVREDERPAPLPGASRPVYETPYGQIYYFPDVDTLAGELRGVHLRCTAADGFARLYSPTFGGRELYLATHPLATISLMELLERRGRYSLHAACLARDGRGVLLAGPTGAGKSTLTMALVRGGLEFLSDDVVFLDHDEGAVRVLGFPDDIGVSEDTAARFGELAGLLSVPPADGFPKRLVGMEDAFAARAIMSCEPQALVFPDVVPGGASDLRALDPREAWLRLVPDVLLTQDAGTRSHLEALAALLAQVRCYRLESGADLERSARLLEDLLT